VIITDIDGAQSFDAKVRFVAHRVNGSEKRNEGPRVSGSISAPASNITFAVG
jgi:hypothetical protein